MPCYSPLKGFKNTNGALVFKRSGNTIGKMEVACGQCLGCRTDRQLMWTMRIIHESVLHQDNYGNTFITLTYRSLEACTDKQFKAGHYVPKDLSLNYYHFRDFIKRLRRHFKQKIRYFHCGEYGDENLRPHYHAILFNCSFDDQIVEKQEQGITTWSSDTLTNIWPYGFSTIGDVNYDTAAYTAGYILKKINGQAALDAYLRNDEYGVAFWVKPPYITMSLKPGIGEKFYALYKADFFPSDESPVPGVGVRKKVPRYYEKILAEEDPAMLACIKEARQTFIAAHREDYTAERLKSKYIIAQKRQSEKQRTL